MYGYLVGIKNYEKITETTKLILNIFVLKHFCHQKTFELPFDKCYYFTSFAQLIKSSEKHVSYFKFIV